MFDITQYPFDELKSKYLRINNLKKMGVQSPVALHAGNRLTNVVENNYTVMKNKDVFVYYVPPDKVFKTFFELPNVIKIILEN